MSSNRFFVFGLCLGLCLVLASAFAPAAQAQSLAGYNCIQNLSNSEFKTSSASSLASACQMTELSHFSTCSGTQYYCVKNQSNGQYLENKATKLANECNGHAESRTMPLDTYPGDTVYCVQNVGNSEY